jgi:hypothetical protein
VAANASTPTSNVNSGRRPLRTVGGGRGAGGHFDQGVGPTLRCAAGQLVEVGSATEAGCGFGPVGGEQVAFDRGQDTVDDVARDRVEDTVEVPGVLEGLRQVHAPSVVLALGEVFFAIGVGAVEPCGEGGDEHVEGHRGGPVDQHGLVAVKHQRGARRAGPGEAIDVFDADAPGRERNSHDLEPGHGPPATHPRGGRRCVAVGLDPDPRRRVLRAHVGPLAVARERCGLATRQRFDPCQLLRQPDHRGATGQGNRIERMQPIERATKLVKDINRRVDTRARRICCDRHRTPPSPTGEQKAAHAASTRPEPASSRA